MDPTIDPKGLAFVIHDLARLMRGEFEQRIAREAIPVTPAEARVLAHVARCDAARQNVLAERLGIAPMTLTGFLDRLEAQGFVTRSGDPADRRAKLVSLTPGAAPILAAIARAGAETRAVAREGVGEADWLTFQEVARRAAANLSRRRDAREAGQGAS